MVANTKPIYSIKGNVTGVQVLTVNTALTGLGTVGTDIYLVHTSSATDGSRVEKIRIRHMGTNSAATVLRIFINNGLTNGTAANNYLYTELTIAANTISQVAQSIEYEIPMNIVLPISYRIYATVGTASTAGLMVTAIAGDY